MAPPRGDQAVLVVDGRGAWVRFTVRQFQQVVQKLTVEQVRPFQVHPLHRFHRVGSQQILPELDGPVAFRFACGVPDGVQQLPTQPPQFGESFLHPVDLRQRLEQHLGVIPLPVFQRQTQRLRQVSFLRQHRRDTGVLVLVQAFHKVVCGVGVNPHKLHFQLLYSVAGYLPSQFPPQEPRHGRVDLVNAGRDRFQKPGRVRRPQHGPARRVRTTRGLHPAFRREQAARRPGGEIVAHDLPVRPLLRDV